METCVAGKRHNFIIGDTTFSAGQVKSGLLDFLTSLSSTNTQIVCLGDCASNTKAENQSRFDFYRMHGFAAAAKHLRSRDFPDAADRELAKESYALLPGWDKLSPDQKYVWIKGAKGDADVAHKRYEDSNIRQALDVYRNALVEKAILNDGKPDLYGLPSILAYPDAWRAFVEYRSKSLRPRRRNGS